MKALIQRVTTARVDVDGQTIGAIDAGVLAYIGIGHDDDFGTACRLIDKILTYRIFENVTDVDKLGKLDKSVADVGGGLLLVSQFTLMAKTDKGRRPDFAPAMPPALASALFEQLVEYAKSKHPNVATGQFGANMQVIAQNDGPINFILEV
ncbi:D-aminoacyl-tRNA deacylase [Moraxella sp. FZLJ2107]|uniref:D-aminoacyl-tRNA deacylase n=1 Tax=unclassified Moraxella TaxID=2685852 RepID=UPI00209C13C4|nr:MULTISPECIES: D-aminoacyl-tRNA deacylase [unclassified Moraxella]USZ15550.1 D-aminoacyl-tRNA deacylase [Moraxella sp. FZFQ2102]UTO04629.1 D-aminoacyl-tRNA deacylase [Moraxella sp. FZLJ2107]UTO21357.1 D-aminoacyl-tRNA deacylase [Moraxella sp. FZLJ2109]